MAPRKSKTPRPRPPPGYSRTKVADLVADLTKRGLPNTGKKADLIARLEEDDRRKAANVEAQPTTAIEPPKDATHASAFSGTLTETYTLYHSAYTGNSVTSEGKFDHFVRITDESHRRRGHWSFASVEDDNKAYARGLSTPEEILVEEDRSRSTPEEIILRWIPGSDETEMNRAVVGPASHHLRTLYELRKIVGQPMSFRGQIPVYPISQDPRVKQYWAVVNNLQQPKVFTGATVVDLSNSTPFTGLQPGPSNASGPSQNAKSASKLPTRPHGMSNLQQHHTPNTQEAQTVLKLSDDFRPQLPHRPTVSPFTSLVRAPSPFTPDEIGRVKASGPSEKSAAHSPHYGVALDYTEQQEEAFAPLVIEFDSLGNPAALHGTERPVTPDFLKGVPLPLPSYSPSPKRDSSLPDSPPKQLPPQSVYPTQHAPPSPRTHKQTPEFDLEEWGGLEQIEKDFVALDTSTPALVYTKEVAVHFDGILRTASPSPVVDSSESKTSNTEPTEAQIPRLSLLSGDASTGPSLVADEELVLMNCDGETGIVQAPSPPLIRPEIYSRVPADYLDIPCMDCGLMEVEGHAFDCHIGNITFSENLTVLDHRRIADAVGHFDPGPWTTHFDPYPMPPSEDPETQISDMANVIRNEDTYKDDEELHGLPDAVMVLLWALKSLPGVHIITE